MNNFPPTLASALNLTSEHGNGLCFHLSAALCYDLPKSMLVIGVFKPDAKAVEEAGGKASEVPFYHCWVEYFGQILAPTAMERLGGLMPMERKGYYNINGAHNVRRITRERLLEIFKRNPEILSQLKFGIQPQKDGLLVDKLMKAAKLEYQLSDCNGVIP